MNAEKALRTSLPVALLMLIVIGACGSPGGDEPATETTDFTPPTFDCAPEIGLTLPEGFCGVVFADGLGRARHLAVTESGDVYVMRQQARRRRGQEASAETPDSVWALRDADGDGTAEIVESFAPIGAGTGMGIHDGYLYIGTDVAIHRVALTAGELVPTAEIEEMITFERQGQHANKAFTFDDQGNVYVGVGGPSNACQQESRTPGSPGADPCPQLEWQAGILRFAAAVPGQTVADAAKYATGIRNAVALDWNRDAGQLYALQHGRDSLATLWPEYFNDEQSAELPAEEFLLVEEGADFGWPYCYWDLFQDNRILSPEYGGDGRQVGRCADFGEPIFAFPGHWAPNDLVFYAGSQFPARYRGGAFIAWHGSWNRAPLPQDGFQISFVEMDSNGLPAGDYEQFADGFGGERPIEGFGNVDHRPTGLAVGPDGSLYISDDVGGRIWRIVYAGTGTE